MVDLLNKDFKASLNVLQRLKKGVEKVQKMIQEQNANVNEEPGILKGNQNNPGRENYSLCLRAVKAGLRVGRKNLRTKMA